MHPGRPRGDFPHLGPPPEDPSRDKAIRSIFVANISFETTEEQLRSVLCEVGPVVSLKLIYDPGTGKSRGFGFCEYEDPETAMSAVRNLAGRELNGRQLRIDSAANAPGEGFRVGGPPPHMPGGRIEPPLHGPPIPPESAPEAITKAVASLPPEQMFELMKQMKWSVEHNPQEARSLLLHNPQLAYALLQAQVHMYGSPRRKTNITHRPDNQEVVMRIVDLETAQKLLHRPNRGPALNQPPPDQRPPPSSSHEHPPHPQPPPPGGRGEGPYGPREQFGPPRGEMFGGPPPPTEHFGSRPMRGPPGPGPGPHGPRDPQGGHYGGRGPPDMRPSAPPSHSPGAQAGMSPQDQEKAALIMQVLSLSDEQIRMLPPDQRTSILKLKDQIARSGPH